MLEKVVHGNDKVSYHVIWINLLPSYMVASAISLSDTDLLITSDKHIFQMCIYTAHTKEKIMLYTFVNYPCMLHRSTHREKQDTFSVVVT